VESRNSKSYKERRS